MLRVAAASSSSPISALVWLLIPAIALVGGITYVIWVSKFQAKYEKKTDRSVGKFKKFQNSFRDDNSGEAKNGR